MFVRIFLILKISVRHPDLPDCLVSQDEGIVGIMSIFKHQTWVNPTLSKIDYMVIP